MSGSLSTPGAPALGSVPAGIPASGFSPEGAAMPSNRGMGGPGGNAIASGVFGPGRVSSSGPGNLNSAFSPSQSGTGPLGQGGAGSSFGGSGSFSPPTFGVGTGSSQAGGPGTEFSPSQGSTGPAGQEGTGGSGGASGSFGPPNFSVGSGSLQPGSAPGVARGEGLFPVGSPSGSGSSGPGGTSAGLSGGVTTPTGSGSTGPGTSVGPGHPTTPGATGKRRRPKKPDAATAAAIGLGVASSLFALGALGAGIASAVAQNQAKRHGNPCATSTGCLQPPCPKPPRRERRSIGESRVPAEILESIPMNFERLY